MGVPAAGSRPLSRALGAEAGRTLAAVWIFWPPTPCSALVGGLGDAVDATVEAAVIGALTLGALAATLGSGVTKFVEASVIEDEPFQTGRVDSAPLVARIRAPPVGPADAFRRMPMAFRRGAPGRITPSSAARSER